MWPLHKLIVVCFLDQVAVKYVDKTKDYREGLYIVSKMHSLVGKLDLVLIWKTTSIFPS